MQDTARSERQVEHEIRKSPVFRWLNLKMVFAKKMRKAKIDFAEDSDDDRRRLRLIIWTFCVFIARRTWVNGGCT